MTTFITLISVASYLAVALPSMRWLYGRGRKRQINHDRLHYPNLYNSAEAARLRFDDSDRVVWLALAFVQGLLWPVFLPLLAGGQLLARWMEGTSQLALVELEEVRDDLTRRIAVLEAELGMR